MEYVLFSPDQIKFCSMHALNLGVAQWSAGGVLKMLIHWDVFGGDDVPLAQRYLQAWLDFDAWAKGLKIPPLGLQMKLFTLRPHLNEHMLYGYNHVLDLQAQPAGFQPQESGCGQLGIPGVAGKSV